MHTKLEVCMFTDYENVEDNAKGKNWGGLGFGVTQGHRKCHNSIQCIRLPVWL